MLEKMHLVICGDEGTMRYGFKDVVIDSRTGLNPRKNFVLGYGDNNYITIKDIYNGQLNITDKTDKVDDDAIQIIKKRSRIKVGDILFVSIGRIGETAIVTAKDDTWDVNESVFVFTINREIVTPEYFCTLFQSDSVQKYLTGNSSGSTFKSIKMNQLEKMIFDLPPLDVQEDITAKLSAVKAICNLRISELMHLDSLIKARFIEMFGDPEMNPYGWLKTGISTVVHGKATNGFFAKREEYVDDGNVAVLGVAYVVNRMYSQVEDLPRTNDDGNVAVLGVAYVVNRMYSQVEDLPRTNATEADIKKHQLRYGDMLFCRSSLVAEGIGKASIVPENVPEKTLFECHVIRIPLDLNKCVPEFMQVLSTTPYFRNQMIAQSKTATMTTIGQDGILKANIILPPIEKQKEFYSFVNQVDKSKAQVQKALDETQLLFDSLMQEYFG